LNEALPAQPAKELLLAHDLTAACHFSPRFLVNKLLNKELLTLFYLLNAIGELRGKTKKTNQGPTS
jgi:hypothetical protein